MRRIKKCQTNSRNKARVRAEARACCFVLMKSPCYKASRMACNGIPTLPSSALSTKMLSLEAVRVLREVNRTLQSILSQMQALATSLPEYPVVRALPGVGEVLAARLIAEIGDVRRFHSGSALVAYSGIDAPPFQSGAFTGTKRRISKRGSALLR